MNSYDVRQKKKPLPAWVLEKGPFIVLFVFAGIYVLFIRREPTPSAPKPIPHAKLVVVGPPSKTWVEGSDTRIKSIEIKVQNKGDNVAQHVVVHGVVRSNVFALSGKDTIAIGETASFVGEPSSNLHVSDSIDFKLSCGTCAAVVTPHP